MKQMIERNCYKKKKNPKHTESLTFNTVTSYTVDVTQEPTCQAINRAVYYLYLSSTVANPFTLSQCIEEKPTRLHETNDRVTVTIRKQVSLDACHLGFFTTLSTVQNVWQPTQRIN